MALKLFTPVPDTRATGTGSPAADMDSIVDQLTDFGYPYHVLNTTFAGGAALDGVSDSTAAIQACMNAAAAAAAPVLIPAGVIFRVSQLTWNAGQVLQGIYCGTYPGNNAIPTVSVVARLASTNLDLITVPDGVNYGVIRDLAIDGNKNNNTSGRGIAILDGAAGQECQILIERCYVHDNPGSNIYLGHNRRANRVLNSVVTSSGTGDGITAAGSDNTIQGNICGSNGRGGIVLGTTATQNWAATTSFAAAVSHVTGNDCFGNQAGIAVAQFSSDNVVAFNGVDRNTLQGITVFDGASNAVTGNALHSNGTSANNTYGHIDIGAGVTQVALEGNVFGPLDSGISNVASFGVTVAAGAPAGCITGNVGVIDATSTAGGLISLPAKRLSAPPAASVSYSPADPAGTASGTLVMMGLGATCAFTPRGSGAVLVTACGVILNNGAFGTFLSGRFGTGSAPANAAAASGTKWGVGADSSQAVKGASTSSGTPFCLTQVLALTPLTAYWFDLAISANAGGTASVLNVVCSLTELAG